MKILTFTTLYPNVVRPRHGIFIENRVRQLVATGLVTVRVVAPCPWFPFASRAFGKYSEFARVPRAELRHGIPVHHPRYPLWPKLGVSAAPFLMYRALRPAIRRILEENGGFDLIDAHYFYPDGIAAVMLARHFALPVAITGRGSDLNILPRYRLPRRMIAWAAARAQGLSTVSAALRERLVELGVPRARVTVLRNGVDLALFRQLDRDACRARLGLAGPVFLSVGNLVPIKGHETTLAALARLPGITLLVAGDGPERGSLTARAKKLGVADRVRFLGAVPHESLPELYSAADALVLASRHEGWPNVLLEAMACGTPVVASDLPGIEEIVGNRSAGRMFARGDAAALAAAMSETLCDLPPRGAVRAYAERFGWKATISAQLELFREITGKRD